MTIRGLAPEQTKMLGTCGVEDRRKVYDFMRTHRVDLTHGLQGPQGPILTAASAYSTSARDILAIAEKHMTPSNPLTRRPTSLLPNNVQVPRGGYPRLEISATPEPYLFFTISSETLTTLSRFADERVHIHMDTNIPHPDGSAMISQNVWLSAEGAATHSTDFIMSLASAEAVTARFGEGMRLFKSALQAAGIPHELRPFINHGMLEFKSTAVTVSASTSHDVVIQYKDVAPAQLTHRKLAKFHPIALPE